MSIRTALAAAAMSLARFAAPTRTITRPRADAAMYTHTAADALMVALTSIPDPDMVLTKVGLARHQLDRLTYDDEIEGALSTRRDAAVTTPWRLERPRPHGNTEPDEDDLWVWRMLERVMEPFMDGVWQAVPYGYSVTEVVYSKEPGGRIGLADASVKPMQWFRPTPDGALLFLGTTGAITANGVPVDTMFKFYLSRIRPTYANPFGEAMLSRLYWPWFFRHNAWRFWMQFLERFADPFLYGKSDNPSQLVDELLKVGVENVVAVGQEDEMEAVVTGHPGEFEKAEIALTKRVQKLILGQTLTTDTQGVGSQALGRVHNMVREDKRAADLRALTKAGQWLVNALCAINFPGREPPQFCMADARGLEQDRADRDKKLLEAGAIRLTEQYLLRAYDYEAGDFTIPDPGAPTQLPARASAVLSALMATKPKFTPQQRAVEALVEAMGETAPPVDPERIRAAVRAAESPEDLEARLAILLKDMDPEAFATVVERAMFAADVMGYAHGTQRRTDDAPTDEPVIGSP